MGVDTALYLSDGYAIFRRDLNRAFGPEIATKIMSKLRETGMGVGDGYVDEPDWWFLPIDSSSIGYDYDYKVTQGCPSDDRSHIEPTILRMKETPQSELAKINVYNDIERFVSNDIEDFVSNISEEDTEEVRRLLRSLLVDKDDQLQFSDEEIMYRIKPDYDSDHSLTHFGQWLAIYYN